MIVRRHDASGASLLMVAALVLSVPAVIADEDTADAPGFARFEVRAGNDARPVLRDAAKGRSARPGKGGAEIAATGGAVLARCVAIRVATRHLLVAAHCLAEDTDRLHVVCPGRRVTIEPLPLASVVRHATHDVALAAVADPPPCFGAPYAFARTLASDARLGSRTLDDAVALDADRAIDAPERAIRFAELDRDAHVLRLDDRDVCLGRGDSGYPIFVEGALAAMLIGGTEGCPSLQTALRLDRLAPWLDAVLADSRTARTRTPTDARTLDAGDCPSPGCLIVPDTVRHCSLDPEQLPPNGPFAAKATLTLSAGRYAPRPDGGFPLPPIVLETFAGTLSLEPDGFGEPRLLDTAGAGSGTRLQLVGHYAAPGGTAFELVLTAGELEPSARDARGRTAGRGRRHGFADARDAAAFLERGALVLLRALDGASSSSGTGGAPIAFAPCTLSVPSERFDFELADGLRVGVTLGAAVGAHELGFYVGRPLEATVETPDERRRITGHETLAFIGGSRRQGELALPTLAVWTGPHGDGCGFLFDSSEWDRPAATNGYVARRLDCDGRTGAPLDLRASRYPERYVLP